MKLFEKVYHGFEDIYDLSRDVMEAFDERINPNAKDIPGEFKGKVIVTIIYEGDKNGS